ncbi:MAG: DUF1330 domain-containing protein [Pseudomonadota bacterium]|jgi:uncharacterized protein (DUF1330 family)|uniref:DUF1330 domain-containing protein n=1 Tax=Qipengyuania flava TaxID=192812 RepID=A0A5P6NFA3_9SPHN|nr:DUF1330 domain-containing protein [Qipengyuania flava]KZX55330.1 hypothetical protein A3711_00025 [Erythrobacter sp. HI00D59]KZX88101.1 hypothetical protein A3719_08520 [Erythrobacter sp. HI0020]KZY10782.1 hypothetical protein A3726_15185 [Erythrobacter sp. HI0037]KZY17518.1 hypothetical protein A3727_17500 [Erythrobacter sp. HI0038]MEC7422198.1 DUF1330 domain-containing protein [Pseudomonadota bacterium]OAN83058.1 DUF1330 domain-containing protein [Erythrobacter sp. EhN03]|tara:strand:- start:271 stop:702 length:432 start_codon:yes stop_codon:yes gene_type:complete
MASSYIDPSPANFQAFKDLPRDEPIHMLNLLEYREQAEYPQGHEHAGKGWSGRRAYEEYGKTSGPIFRRVGGTIVWRGSFQTMVTGPDAKRWHDGFVAQYPNAGAFFEMIKDPEYQQAVVNRTAALVDSRLMRFEPGEAGEGF